jgi:hypothetical protein
MAKAKSGNAPSKNTVLRVFRGNTFYLAASFATKPKPTGPREKLA